MHRARGSRPLVYAHRGGSRLGPENTLAAFDRGLAAGADGLELDVRFSRDGVVVVHHDRLVDRTTTASGAVADFTAAELASLDAGSRFGGSEEPAGIPTLRDVLHRYPAVPVIVELKLASQALARAVIDTARDAGAIERICVGSFSWRALRAARAYAPGVETSAARMEVRLALYQSWVGLSPRGAAYRSLQVPERSGGTRVVSPRFVALAHQAGLAVEVWTVDAPADIRRLLDWGVDGIISDRPDLAAATVREWVAGRRA